LEVGTAGYRAPEVLTGVDYGPKIDVFACGYIFSIFAFLT
jgi:serine/threonine protein kinase